MKETEFKGEAKSMVLEQEIPKKKRMEKVVDLTEDDNLDEDKVFQLMVEIEALKCEKKKAEREVQFWKEKYFKELELRVSHLSESSISKDGERPSAGRREVGLSCEDGLQAGTDSDYMLSKKLKGVDLMHIGEIGCKRIGNLQAAGIK